MGCWVATSHSRVLPSSRRPTVASVLAVRAEGHGAGQRARAGDGHRRAVLPSGGHVPQPGGAVRAQRGQGLAVGAERDGLVSALPGRRDRGAGPLAARRLPQLHPVARHGQGLAVRAEGEPGHRAGRGDRGPGLPPGRDVPHLDRPVPVADGQQPASGAERGAGAGRPDRQRGGDLVEARRVPQLDAAVAAPGGQGRSARRGGQRAHPGRARYGQRGPGLGLRRDVPQLGHAVALRGGQRGPARAEGQRADRPAGHHGRAGRGAARHVPEPGGAVAAAGWPAAARPG